jgi:hypothetical protein
MMITPALDHELGELAERLLHVLPARQRGRRGELAGGHDRAQHRELRMGLALVQRRRTTR